MDKYIDETRRCLKQGTFDYMNVYINKWLVCRERGGCETSETYASLPQICIIQSKTCIPGLIQVTSFIKRYVDQCKKESFFTDSFRSLSADAIQSEDEKRDFYDKILFWDRSFDTSLARLCFKA